MIICPHSKKIRRTSNYPYQSIEACKANEAANILVIDSGGGFTCMGTTRAFRVLERTNRTVTISGYGDERAKEPSSVVNAVTKVVIPGSDEPLIFLINNMTLNDDPNQNESLAVPFEMMRANIQVCSTPSQHGGICGAIIDGELFPFQYDGEKLYYNIAKPTDEELARLPWYEISPRVPPNHYMRRTQTSHDPLDIPIEEWRKRLAMLPEEVVRKTLQNTTCFYLHVENDNRDDPRRHYKSTLRGIQHRRRNEVVATDTFFPSKISSQGHTCSQFFVGQKSNKWAVYPLKKESQNFTALQDHCRESGLPDAIRSDNAQSELGAKWTSYTRDHCIRQESTVPHSPWMNFAERNIGQLGSMVRKCHQIFGVPHCYNNWTQRWCCHVHNIASCRSLNWLSPNAIADGYTPDLSPFRFHIWEPIWYYDHTRKAPESRWQPGRWMGFAESTGDQMTYWIRTERPRPAVNGFLIRNVVRTRRKNIGTPQEGIESNTPQDPFLTNFELPNHPMELLQEENPVSGETQEDTEMYQEENLIPEETREDTEMNQGDFDKTTPSVEVLEEEMVQEDQLDPNELKEVYDQFEVEDIVDDYDFVKVIDHHWEDGVLVFHVRYVDKNKEEHILEEPFDVIKKDIPLEIAKYIRNYVKDSTRKGFHILWATKVIKQHGRAVRRLYNLYNIDRTMRLHRTRRAKQNRTISLMASTNGQIPRRKAKNVIPAEKFGFRIPRSTREALIFDKEDNSTHWADAIAKEMDSLDRLRVFEYHPTGTHFPRSNGWQYAPLRMIFDIKQQDLRRKARLVVGGHVIDSSNHLTYSSTIQDISIRILMIIAVQNSLSFMTADIGNAFCTAPCAEKIWTRAGEEFGSRAGCIVTLRRALYGLKTASRSYHEFFGDCLIRMGFTPSRADQDLWWRKSDDYSGYDYIATHVDDIICAAKDPSKYMAEIEMHFKLRDITDQPSYYLGNDLMKKGNKFHISSSRYIKEVIRKYQEIHGSLRQETVPMRPGVHPETDDSSLLEPEQVKEFQHIIGVCQWLIVAGRFDISYAISSLSRFSSAPREGHLMLARKVFGYLKKFPKRGYVVNPQPPKIDAAYQNVEVKCDFGNQYSYFREDIDPRFPDPIMPELDINIFVDADHGHDKATGRSITGFLGMIGSTPTVWGARRQSSVQASTFGAEFTALKKAVEEAITLRYYLRSMGVKVSQATPIWVDNMGVVLNATNAGSPLNKKHIALSYHFVREHQANKIVSIRKIDTSDNYADPFTKALTNDAFHSFFRNLLVN